MSKRNPASRKTRQNDSIEIARSPCLEPPHPRHAAVHGTHAFAEPRHGLSYSCLVGASDRAPHQTFLPPSHQAAQTPTIGNSATRREALCRDCACRQTAIPDRGSCHLGRTPGGDHPARLTRHCLSPPRSGERVKRLLSLACILLLAVATAFADPGCPRSARRLRSRLYRSCRLCRSPSDPCPGGSAGESRRQAKRHGRFSSC